MPFVLFVVLTGLRTLSAQQAQSVWDGIYTAEQAKRGEGLFGQTCASCHGFDLMGGETAPALADGQFRSNWNGLSVGDLFERIRVSMPPSGPGTLTRQQYADVVAFLFFRSEFPAGKTELSTKTEVLKQIAFEAVKP